LQSVLNEKADELGKTSGFIRRKRKMTGSNYVKTLLFAWLPKPDVTVEGIARAGFTHGLKISAQGLDKRFTEKAAQFLKSVLEAAVSQVVTLQQPVSGDIFSRFTGIYLADGSTVALPNALADWYAGTGCTGHGGKAAVKIDTRLELKTGLLQFDLLDGRHSDNRSHGAEAVYPAGSLRLQDLGYFKLSRMKAQSERGEYWLSRLQPGTRVFSRAGDKIDLPELLLDLEQTGVIRQEMAVKAGAAEQLPARLLLWKVPAEQAARRRAKMKENAQNQGRLPTQASLLWCDWNLMVTNVEQARLSFEEAYVLYGVRWQIELLFKLWKTHGQLGHSRSKKPERILCELYVKLLGVLVQHWLFLAGLWQNPHRSLVKGGQMLKGQAERLAHSLGDRDALIALLEELAERFQYGCTLNRRKKKPNTSQRLDSKYAFP
jgi:hypothetical protein